MMRRSTSALALSATLLLAGCDPTGPSDTLWLTSDVTSAELAGEDEVMPAANITLDGPGSGSVSLPLCPDEIHGTWPVYGIDEKVGAEWETTFISLVDSSCDYAAVETTTPFTPSSEGPDLIMAVPRKVGTFRFWLFVETASGERRSVYSQDVTVVE
jgi:hypothetical protein